MAKAPVNGAKRHAGNPNAKGRTSTKDRIQLSKATLSRDARTAVMHAFNYVGGVEYLIRLAKRKNPALFVQLLGKCINRDDGADAPGITFVVQQFNVQAQPTPGVLVSPVVEHVAPPLRLVASGNDLPPVRLGVVVEAPAHEPAAHHD